MADVIREKFHFYRTNSLVDIHQGLGGLLRAGNTLKAQKIPTIEKMLTRVIPLYNTLVEETGGEPISAIDRELIRFLDVRTINQFLSIPTDMQTRNDLSMQFIMLAAATGNYKLDDPFTPYSIPELAEILRGEGVFYDDIIFIRTLRAGLEGVGNEGYGLMALTTMPKIVNHSDVEQGYSWDEAFMFDLLLQTAWRSFAFLEREEQQFLLQNYLYLGIVAGVPVRTWLSEVLQSAKTRTARDEVKNFFLQSIMKNTETVPTDTAVLEGADFTVLLKQYFEKVYNEEIVTLAQEKFLNGFYAEGPHEDAFRAWLRELLSIALRLRKGEALL